jgi:hypothetical protein
MITIIIKCDYDHISGFAQKLILYTSNAFKMKKLISAFQAVFVVLIPFSGMAHPGHGETEGYTITHYFTEPVHATATALLMAAVLCTVSYIRRKNSQDKNA